MTVYYLVYSEFGSMSIGNFRTTSEGLIKELGRGKEFRIREIPNEDGKPNATAKILEIAEIPEVNTGSIYVEAQRQYAEMMKPVSVVQNTQATADDKMARVRDELEKGVLPLVQRVKLKAETHPTDRAIAEWIVGEKTKHASIVSRAYDTGESGSLEKYTEEVQSIVRMTLDILEGGGPEKYADESNTYSLQDIQDLLGRALPDNLWKSKRDVEYDPQGYPDANELESKTQENVIKTPIERKTLHYTCEKCNSKKDLTWLEGAEIRNYIRCDLCKNIWEYNHWMKKDDVPSDPY